MCKLLRCQGSFAPLRHAQEVMGVSQLVSQGTRVNLTDVTLVSDDTY